MYLIWDLSRSEATSAMTQQLPRLLTKHNDYNEDDVQLKHRVLDIDI